MLDMFVQYIKNLYMMCFRKKELTPPSLEDGLWSGVVERKKNQMSLFRGYVFVYIDFQKQRLDILQTNGVENFITFGSKPAAIPEAQMYWLDKLVSSPNIKHEQEFPLSADMDVIIGSFKELRGKIKQKKSTTRLVTWFDVIMQGVPLDICRVYLKGRKQESIDSRHFASGN